MMSMPDRFFPRSSLTAAAVLVLAAAVLGPMAGEAMAQARAGSGTPEPAAKAAEAPAAFIELNEALTAAKAKLEDLSKATEIAAEIGTLRERVLALGKERTRLAAALEQSETARDAAEQAAERSRDELRLNQAAIAERRAREAELLQATERSAAELAEAQEQLAATGQQLADADAAREQAALRVTELRALLEQSQAEGREARTALARAGDELASLRAARAAAEQERDVARAEANRLQVSLADLGKQLADAKVETDQLRADKARADQQLALLEEAASSATRIARQNLIAVEEKVELLQSALGEPLPAASDRDDGDGRLADETEAAGLGEEDVLPPPLKPKAARPSAGADLAGIKAGGSSGLTEGSAALAASTGNLPFEMRLQAQSLLADLDAKSDARGVLMTVPGERLFTVNSDEIGQEAHGTLAKIAEIIGIYEGSEVLITGHTDGIGESVYNRMLSERRADLIRTFFVDNFGIAADRLKTQGQGEDEPLASNATNAGRQANRRVEVLIMN
jgi:outer membrane protein OmpA-like peptidoglycan-associated protein